MKNTTEDLNFQQSKSLSPSDLFYLELEYKRNNINGQCPSIEELKNYYEKKMSGMSNVSQLLLG